MKKSHQALLRYLNMDVATAVETFKGFITDETSKIITLPYQQNLDYILIKFQGLSKILVRVVGCLKKCASYFLGLVKAGSFYSKGMVFLSTISSVWCQSRDVCKNVVSQYNRLREFRENLVAKPGASWVDYEYELPEKLELWLGEDWTQSIINETFDKRLLLKEIDIESFIEKKDKTSDVFGRVKGEDRDESTLEQVTASQEQEHITEANEELELEDFTPIPRTLKKEPESNLKPMEHSISSLSCKESINVFLKNETHFRKVDAQKSLTISKMKKKIWKEFRDDIKNKTILMQEGAFVNYVKEFLEEFNVQ